MKKHTTDHGLTPWEHHPYNQDAFSHLEDLHDHKTHEKKEGEIKPVIVHSVHLNLNPHDAKVKQISHKPSHIQQYITQLEDKAVKQKLIEQKLHLHHENKRLEVFIKPITKNDINATIPQEPLLHPKVTVERPIKHMSKNNKESASQYQKHEGKNIKEEAQTNIRHAKRKMSVDNLHKSSKTALNTAQKSSEYEDLIIKKCYLKNINVFEGDNKNHQQQKVVKKAQALKKPKASDNNHVLDRLLSRLD